jgi:hypothetical protein
MIYFYLLSLWPLINYLKDNILKINSYSEIGLLTALSLFMSFAGVKIIQKYSKTDIERYLLPIFIVVAMFFNYGPSVDLIGGSLSIPLKTSYLWSGFLLLSIYGAWRLSSSKEIRQASKLLIAVVVFLSVAELTYIYGKHIVNRGTTSSKENVTLNYVFKHKPNIYYLLVDAYARQDTLMELGDFNNEPFLQALEQEGFIVSRDSFSNYHFTGASLSATMDMQYHKATSENFIDCQQMHRSLKGDNNVRRTLKANHYKVINMPAHWHQISCHGYEDKCIKNNSYEVYQSFLSSTPLRTFHFPNTYIDFEKIKQLVTFFPDEPKFVFVHLAHVHDSVYDSNGDYKPTSQGHPVFSNVKEAQNYLSSIKIVNKKLLDVVHYIKSHDRDAIIIIQSDHGPTFTGNQIPQDPAFWLAHPEKFRLRKSEDFRYTFGILSAIYVPRQLKNYEQMRNYWYNKLSLVNTFRLVFALLSEQTPTLLADESHFLYFDKSINGYREENIYNYKTEGK